MRLFSSLYRYAPDLLFLAVCLLLHIAVFRQYRQHWVRTALTLSAAWIVFSVAASHSRIALRLPTGDWMYWLRGAGHLWGLTTVGTMTLWLVSETAERKFSLGRRKFFSTARAAILAAPAVVTGHGLFYGRSDFYVKEVDIPIPGLHKDLQGLRILQLSDIHMSPFLSEDELIRVIDVANETKPHLAVVTGDLITDRHDPLEACIRQLGRVKADHGVLGCNGNHEIFADGEELARQLCARQGINILRRQATSLRFGDATMNVAGVDYQQFHKPYLVDGEKLVQSGVFNLLLSHNPDVFPVAARQGFDLTLAGHTHGGQVTFEILHQYANVARIFTPYVYGHYTKDSAALYVTRGIGTVGIPARVGAPPEISVIRLCAS